MLRTLKHHVLKEMGKSGSAGAFVGGANVIPQIDRYEWEAVIFRDDYIESIFQPVLLKFKFGTSGSGRRSLGVRPGNQSKTKERRQQRSKQAFILGH
jgi:hypothetical protein